MIPEQDKRLAAASNQQVKDYAVGKAREELDQLKRLAQSEEPEPVPQELAYLQEAAKQNYKLERKNVPDTWTVEAVLKGFRSEQEVAETIEEHYREKILGLKDMRNDILQLGLDLSGGMRVLLEADPASLEDRLGHEPTQDDQKQAIDRAMEILTNRIDKFGVTEPEIRRQGNNRIAIEVPGAADPERVRSFLLGKGRLNFHIVDEEATDQLRQYLQDHSTGYIGAGDDIEQPDFLDPGTVVRGFYKKDQYGIDRLQRYIVIKREPGLSGGHIQDAQVGSDPVTNQPVINFTLDREGGEIFFQLTSANVGKTLAIVLDNKVKAGARISEPIRGSVRMTGFDRKEARDLALVLKTAAMPVDLNVSNLQSIGASLGEDSIRAGVRAILLGFVLIIIFMIIYYKAAGIVADIALILNLFIIVAILSAFNLTLTLTSIAGIILTVGMAVDANVIIFERIREEYRLGKSPEASVKAGFKKAFWTIMDANVTTFIAAIFLSQLASGPVQGFAYTLAVGIVSSMFTALVVSRLIFDFSVEVLKVKRLSIGWRVR
jgi:preprotein translocase subunit SecD